MNTEIKISSEEHTQRVSHLVEHMNSEKLTGVVLFNNFYVLYYTGFAFIPTERPIAFILNSSGETTLFVPRLEVEHAQGNSIIQNVVNYPEYPHKTHPMQILNGALGELGINGVMGVDTDGYPWILGYHGPDLSEITGRNIVKLTSFIEEQMMIKSQAEMSLIRESVKWGNLAHALLQEYTRIGVSETEASQRASQEANQSMLGAIGPIYKAQSPFSKGASAGYRGQIGRNAAIPHALANNLTFQAGDVLVSGAGAPVWGYNSELERTMIIGPASKEQQKMFQHMLALQEAAFDAIQPGEKCSSVDSAVRQYYQEHDLMPYWKHHVGHAIGLRYHEGPFLDVGDDTTIMPGMVFTVEPGLYVPELGGFRHSDTIQVTDDGIEILTYYPRDLESLTIPL